MALRIRFWGTRGSIPVALTSRELRERIAHALLEASGRHFGDLDEARTFAANELDFSLTHTFGGHTPCVEIDTGEGDYLVCDMGSGARPFGARVLAQKERRPATIHVFQSHVHWDHIMGFPFFGPAYVPGTKIRIHGCHAPLEHAYRLQQANPCFPVDFSQLAADIQFVTLTPGVPVEVAGFTVTPHLQLHGGDSYGYRFEREGKVVVYSTDSEHKLEDPAESDAFAKFFHRADAVIFDAMYALADAISVKADWGHSSNMVGVELCQKAQARRLVLFHHEPANSDATLLGLLEEARRFEELTRAGEPLEVLSAYDGMEIEL